MTVVARIVSSDPVQAGRAETILRKAGVLRYAVEHNPVVDFFVELYCNGRLVTVFGLKELLSVLFECGWEE